MTHDQFNERKMKLAKRYWNLYLGFMISGLILIALFANVTLDIPELFWTGILFQVIGCLFQGRYNQITG